MSVEKEIQVFGLKKRFDLVVYDEYLKPLMLVECKKNDALIQQNYFDQAAAYNLALKAPYLAITNGKFWHLAQIDFLKRNYLFIDQLLKYPFK